MRILVGHRGSVDFDSPLELDEQKKQKFINFIKKLFDDSVVEVVPKPMPRDERLGEKFFGARWSNREYRLLLIIEYGNDILTEKLGRSWMGIIMKRGAILPDFDAWCARNGYTRKGDYDTLIKKYLEEKEYLKKYHRMRSQLLECNQCGVLHLPEYGHTYCEMCTGRLQKISVDSEERLKLYRNQPKDKATPEWWKEFFARYPAKKEV